ncbi:MAG: methylenetetrahydrofolate reductase, partial [Pseudomonadota bacterium]|nr:methylenetetrahydrofolate reductase [Pseudomonadota bacterium]
TQGGSGHFRQALKAGQFVITAEVNPPVSCLRGDLLAKALPLKALADAVNVTDGAGARANMDVVTAAAILLDNGIEPVLQLTCRDRNRIGLQAELLAAATWGVRNVLALRGDDPIAGDQPDAKPVFDLDSRELIETAVMIRDRGQLPSGRKISGKADFFVGAADTPIDPPAAGWSPRGLNDKISAGAQFAQTQFCMDAGIVRRYAARLAEEGVFAKCFVLIGVALLRSARSAQWIRNHLPGAIISEAIVQRLLGAADPASEGERIALEFLQEMSSIPGIAGVHVMAPNNEAAVPRLLAQARRLALRRAPPQKKGSQPAGAIA